MNYYGYIPQEKHFGKIKCLTDEGAFVLGAKPGEDQILSDSVCKSTIEAPANGRFVTFKEGLILLERINRVVR